MQLALWTEPEPPAASGAPRRPKLPRSSAVLPPRREAATLPCAKSTLERLEQRADAYVEHAHADNTRRAYRADWSAFEAWCQAAGQGALPATPHTLALYLAHLAERGKRPSTIRRARVAIGLAHGHAGLPRPDQHARVRALERGIGRTHGAREEGPPPLLDHQLAQVVKTLGRSARDERDRAILLLGFAGAFRASELAGLNLEDLTFTPAGLDVKVRRSKEDQLARGASTQIPKGHDVATCPVRALAQWIGRVGRPSGPLFRVIQGAATIEHQRISTRCVSRALQRAVERAGLDTHYSSHSLRSGLATSAYAHGATRREIQMQGRWQDPRSVDRYIQMEHVPGRKNVAEGLL